MERTELRVSTKHLGLRITAFIIFLSIAVGAFAVGIGSLGQKKPGYYTVTPDSMEDTPYYAAGIKFDYYFDGAANEIKHELSALKSLYGGILHEVYMQLDAGAEYEGVANIATLNRNPGQWVAVSPELFSVLQDAARRTSLGEGYSVFAGALTAEWNSVLTLSQPEEFDPLLNAEIRARIEDASALLRGEDCPGLEFREADHSVRLTVGDVYARVERLREFSAAPLDLGLMKEAYTVLLVSQALADKGYTGGIFTTEGGITFVGAGDDAAEADLVTLKDGRVTVAGTAALPKGCALSMRRAFPTEEGELCYYTLSADGCDHLRSPLVNALTGEIPDAFLSVYALSSSGTPADAVEAAYESLRLFFGLAPNESLQNWQWKNGE